MQFNSSGLDRTETTAQKKKCFRPGWIAGSNAISRQSNASGLEEWRLKPRRKSKASDGTETSTPAASNDSGLIEQKLQC
jgi:hypothetical protein